MDKVCGLQKAAGSSLPGKTKESWGFFKGTYPDTGEEENNISPVSSSSKLK